MKLKTICDSIKCHSKDVRMNLDSVMKVENSPTLTLKQIYGIALTSAYTIRDSNLIEAFLSDSNDLDVFAENDIDAIKSATTIMAMNNLYYRFCHMVEKQDFLSMPAGLRMNVIAKHGIEKADFELYSLAASIINGCELCVRTHSEHLLNIGISKASIQSCAKITSVVNASSVAMFVSS